MAPDGREDEDAHGGRGAEAMRGLAMKGRQRDSRK